MKQVLLFFLLTTIGLQLKAQSAHDVIYLKNGSIIRGYVVGDSLNKRCLYTIQGNMLCFSNKEVRDIQHQQFKYVGYTSAGVIMGSALNEKPVVLSLLTEQNIIPFEFLAFGMVTGVELINEAILPLGFNLKLFMPLKTRLLYFNTSLGKSFPLEKPLNYEYLDDLDNYGGIFTTVELGVNIPLNHKNGLFFAFGYRYNELNYDYNKWGFGSVDMKKIYHRLSMRMGVSLQ